MNVSRETIEGQLTIGTQISIGNLLLGQIRREFIPLRDTCKHGTSEWWEYQEMIDRNMKLIRTCQERIKSIQQQQNKLVDKNVSRETSEDHE